MSDLRSLPSPPPPVRLRDASAAARGCEFTECAPQGMTTSVVHISPLPQAPTNGIDLLQADGAYMTPKQTPKKNQREANEDFDRSFQVDEQALTLKHPVPNGEGGIGEVWVGELVDHNGAKHEVAVKRYPSAFGPEEMKMFRRETAVLFLAAMRCHNVCKVYGTAVKDGKLCIIMKLYKESMRGLLARTPGRKLNLGDVQRYGMEICKAIAELHEQNIILQDLKPPNILLDEYDHCVLADFGISKVMQGTCPHMPSHVQGTFNYMSPEAFDPEQFGGITTQADSWSFACTLLEMLTGDMPWKGMKMVQQMLRKCFSFNPEGRPTFKQMYAIFRSDWGGRDESNAKQGNGRDPLGFGGGLGPILDVLGINGRSPSGPSSPPPRASVGFNRLQPEMPDLGHAHPGVDNESLMVGLYKKAADAEDAKREADSAKKELETLKEQIMVLREESASSDGIIKGAIADKEEVVCQLSKVMKVCEELQKERKSLAQQLLDMQDQLMSQEQKISEDRGHLQTAEAARKSAEDQLADLSVAHQQLLKQTSDCDDAPRLLSKVQRESDEANATIQNLVAKLEDVTQELIAVTEERDKISDEHERLRREVRDKQMSSASLEDDYHHLREKVQELSEKQRFELEQAQQQHNANVAKLLSQHKYDLEQVREDLAARQQQLLEQKRQNEMLQDKLSASRIVEQQQQDARWKIQELEAQLKAKMRETSDAHRKIQELEAELKSKMREISDAHRKVQELEAQLDAKMREISYAKSNAQGKVDGVKKELSDAKEEIELLNRRLAALALENKNLQAKGDKEIASKSQHNENADRQEKERAQWQRDRESLLSCLKEMEEMETRLGEADKRAHSLAMEKRQLEAKRLQYEHEADAERARLEDALAKQRIEYEKRISELEQVYEKRKVNLRDSESTVASQLPTERSIDNSIEVKCDGYRIVGLDVQSDTQRDGGTQDSSGSSSPESQTTSSVRVMEVDSNGNGVRDAQKGNQGMVDPAQEALDAQERVKRVLHELAIECDRNNNSRNPSKTPSHPSQETSSPPPAMLLNSMLNPVRPITQASTECEAGTESPHTASDRPKTRRNRGCDLQDAREVACSDKKGSASSSVWARERTSGQGSGDSIQSQPKGQSLGLVLDGTRVKSVVRGSPACAAGLRPEDLIRNVNGIGVKREDIMSVLRMQWSGGAEPLNVVAERGKNVLRMVVRPDGPMPPQVKSSRNPSKTNSQ